MSKEETIKSTFDYKQYKLLKNAYRNVVKQKLESFSFNNKEILVSYAKYMLEYLQTKFKYE